jgi:hypothetical protein
MNSTRRTDGSATPASVNVNRAHLEYLISVTTPQTSAGSAAPA